MSSRRYFIPYRRDLKRRSQSLRRDPSPAERKLWFEFLRDLSVKFTRQKPLGRYVADFYCASRMLVIELDGERTAELEAEGIRVMRVTNTDVMQNFEGVCATILQVLDAKP